jgi:hypothetical protein
VRLTEYIGLGHPDVVEEQLRRILRLEAHLFQVAAALESLHAALDDEQRHGVGVVVRIGLRRDDDDIRIDTVGDVGLGTVEHPVVPVLHRRAAHAGEVAACIRLGHGDGEDRLAPHAAGQKALALLRAAEAREVGADQAAVQGAVPVTDTGVGRPPR